MYVYTHRTYATCCTLNDTILSTHYQYHPPTLPIAVVAISGSRHLYYGTFRVAEFGRRRVLI